MHAWYALQAVDVDLLHLFEGVSINHQVVDFIGGWQCQFISNLPASTYGQTYLGHGWNSGMSKRRNDVGVRKR